MLQRSMNLSRPAATRFHPERMFHPRSLAVFGGESRIGRQVLANLAASAFPGDVQLVPPGADPASDKRDARPESGRRCLCQPLIRYASLLSSSAWHATR